MPEGDSSPDHSSSGGESVVARPPTSAGESAIGSSVPIRVAGKNVKMEGFAGPKISKASHSSRINDDSGSDSDDDENERKLASLHSQVRSAEMRWA